MRQIVLHIAIETAKHGYTYQKGQNLATTAVAPYAVLGKHNL